MRQQDRVPEVKVTGPEVKNLWLRLGDADPARAWPALASLIAAPRETLTMLRESLRPATADDVKRIAQLIKELDDEDFAVREKASDELRTIGDPPPLPCGRPRIARPRWRWPTALRIC